VANLIAVHLPVLGADPLLKAVLIELILTTFVTLATIYSF